MINTSRPGFTQRSVGCSSPGGLHRMAYTEWGARDNPRVLVCVHGLARNGRDFDELAHALATDYRVVCPDLVGRGRSDWLRDAAGYTVEQYVADLVVLIARLDVERVDWLGTSLGGLIGMALASLDGTPVARLVLNDVGPVIGGEALKRTGDYLGHAPLFDTLVDAESYIRQVSAPFGELSDANWRQLTESSVLQRPDGRFAMRYDPAIARSLRLAASTDLDLWPIYDRLSCPTLLVRGERSDLLAAQTARAMAGRGPRPHIVEVPGVGHAPMFMDKAQIAIVRDFLRAG